MTPVSTSARRRRMKFAVPGLLLFVALCPTAQAQLNFVATELSDVELSRPLVLEDLNGDDRLDLIDAVWQPTLGRELLVYDQQVDGRFAAVPRRVEIKSEIIAVGFADLRPEPGTELLLLTSQEVFSLSTGIDSYAGNLASVASWKLIADMPDPDRVQFLRDTPDVNGDGFSDLLLPGQEYYGLFHGQADGSLRLVHQFSSINRDLDPGLQPVGGGGLSTSIQINPQDGIRLAITAQRRSPFDGLVQTWGDDDTVDASLMNAENWMPAAQLADMNGDGRADLVFLNVGADIRGQLNLMLQKPDGGFATAPDWQGSIDTRGDIRLADIDGDAFMDLIRLNGEGNEWDLHLFRNRQGSFDLASPDQVMRFSGYDVRPQFYDLNGDGKPELHVSYYTIPVIEAIRNSSIVRTQMLFAGSGATSVQLFNRRPDSSLEESFSAANVRALAEQMSLEYDVDADGSRDAISISDTGALVARRIDANLNIAAEPFWQYVPNHSILVFWVQDLDRDGRPDLVLRHDDSVTLLVARP